MKAIRGTFLLCALVAAPASVWADADPIDPGSWTIAILPDTQIYAQDYPQHFDAQTQWIADHTLSHNIQYVLHEGDIVNNNSSIGQWDNALSSMNILNGVVPYAIAPGNHDYGTNGSANNRDTVFNNPSYFGAGSPYATQSSIGGFYEAGKTDNSYHTFNAGGQDWLVLALEFGPRDDVVTWANQVVTDHPDHLAMLVTHAYMYFDGTRYDWATKGSSQSWNPHSYGVANLAGGVNDGQELWDNLVSLHDNFRFTFNGHVLGDGTGYMADEGVNGNVVNQILANYQFLSQGEGYMRLLEFKPDGDTVSIRTYSPVLDAYDTDFDQEFTVSMTQLPPPPPVLYNSVAANIVVTGPTDPSSNTVDSVLIPQSGQPQVGTLQVNRGDYEVALQTTGGLSYQDGILLATVTEHQREGYIATVEAGRNSFNDGILTLSVMEAGNSGNNELNVNTSVAWFDFDAGWQGAHVNGNGSIAAGTVDGSALTKIGTGRYTLDLGVDSRNDGLLFTIANNNGNTVVPTGVLTDGSGWEIRVQDNAANFAANGEDADFSFLYLPYATEGLVGGLYDGDAAADVSSVGDFDIQRLSTGRYRLTVAGETGETGMLLLTVAKQATDGIIFAPDDNILTYEDDGLGGFIIESRDLAGLGLQNTHFAWAFLSFDDPLYGPLTPEEVPGDANGDGVVDIFDVAVVSNHWLESGPEGDENGDGVVDIFDVAVVSNNWTNLSTSVPEPGAGAMLLVAVGGIIAGRRRWTIVAF